MSEHDGFRVDTSDGVARITLDVPGKFNRVSMGARDELSQVFAELGRDESVRAIVLGGAGDAFTAGGDIAGFLQREPEEVSRLAWNVAAPERCPKPVTARLHGYAFGVGLELALACDFRIAAEGTQLALPEVRLGMIPGSGGRPAGRPRFPRRPPPAASMCAPTASTGRKRSPPRPTGGRARGGAGTAT